MPFKGSVVVSPIPPDGKRWGLLQSFEYEGKNDTFTVPEGFTTDFASVPRALVWLLPRYGRWTQAAILHDYLWDLSRTGQIDKFDADGIFNRAMRELGVPYLRRWIMWAAVRWAAGPKTWLSHGVLPFIKMILVSVPVVLFIALPTTIVQIAIILGFIVELLIYGPLKLLNRDKSKDVNIPEPRDILVS